MTGRVLGQDDALQTLSGRLGRGEVGSVLPGLGPWARVFGPAGTLWKPEATAGAEPGRYLLETGFW